MLSSGWRWYLHSAVLLALGTQRITAAAPSLAPTASPTNVIPTVTVAFWDQAPYAGLNPNSNCTINSTCARSQVEFAIADASFGKDSGYVEAEVQYFYVKGFDEGLDAVQMGLADLLFPVNSAMPLTKTPLMHEKVFAEPIHIMFNPLVLQSPFKFACQQLLALWPCFVMIIVTTLAGGVCVWAVEGKEGEQGLSSPGFWKGVMHGAWFTITTITTVGYGDLVPRTWMGRLMTAMWMIMGTVMMALITALVVTSMTNYQAVAANYQAFLSQWFSAGQMIAVLSQTRCNALISKTAHSFQASQYLMLFDNSLDMCTAFRRGEVFAIMAELAVLDMCRFHSRNSVAPDTNNAKGVFLLDVVGGMEEYEIYYNNMGLQAQGFQGADIVSALSRVSLYMIADDVAGGSISDSSSQQESQAQLALNYCSLLLACVVGMSMLMALSKQIQRRLKIFFAHKDRTFVQELSYFGHELGSKTLAYRTGFCHRWHKCVRFLCCVDLHLLRAHKDDVPEQDRSSNRSKPSSPPGFQAVQESAFASFADGRREEKYMNLNVSSGSTAPIKQSQSQVELQALGADNPTCEIHFSLPSATPLTPTGAEETISEVLRRHAVERMEMAKRHEMDVARILRLEQAVQAVPSGGAVA